MFSCFIGKKENFVDYSLSEYVKYMTKIYILLIVM